MVWEGNGVVVEGKMRIGAGWRWRVEGGETTGGTVGGGGCWCRVGSGGKRWLASGAVEAVGVWELGAARIGGRRWWGSATRIGGVIKRFWWSKGVS